MEELSYQQTTYWKKYNAFWPQHPQVGQQCPAKEEWYDYQGAQIHVDRYPQKDAAISVILLHGAGGYGRLFWPLGALLQANGYEALLPDLPGYGLSQANQELVDYRRWVDLVVDLVASEYAKNQRPIVLVGASVGGYLAYLAAARSSHVKGLIVTTLADPRSESVKASFTRNQFFYRFGLPTLPALSTLAGTVKLPIRWFTRMHAMSNNPALTKVVERDPLGGGRRISLQFMHSLFQVRPALEPEAFDRCPVLLAHPAEDHWTDVRISKPFLDRIAADTSLVMLENCGHFPIEQPGLSQLQQAALEFLQSVADSADNQPTVFTDEPDTLPTGESCECGPP